MKLLLALMFARGSSLATARRNTLWSAGAPAACKAHGVPVPRHLFDSGGHGDGRNGKGDLATWPLLLEQWLARKIPQPSQP